MMKKLSITNILITVIMCFSLVQCIKTNVRMDLTEDKNSVGETEYGVMANYDLWTLFNPEGGICAQIPRFDYISLKTGWTPGMEATSFRDPDITGKLFIPHNKEWVDLDLDRNGESYWKGRYSLKHSSTVPQPIHTEYIVE